MPETLTTSSKQVSYTILLLRNLLLRNDHSLASLVQELRIPRVCLTIIEPGYSLGFTRLLLSGALKVFYWESTSQKNYSFDCEFVLKDYSN